MANLLGLLYLASPTLPIGSFAYSQGLEKAIENEVVSDRESLLKWCRDFMSIGLAHLDLPLLRQINQAITEVNQRQLDSINQVVFASRETAELYMEEVNLGQSLKRLIMTQELKVEGMDVPQKPSFLVGYAWAANALDLSQEELETAFLWSWLENQTAVACKAIPLGQTDAQAILLALRPVISHVVGSTRSEIAGSLPGQVLFSAQHETQYSRLFRS